MKLPLAVLDGRSHEALAACDLTLVASGTATLEAALFKRPMVIVYVMNRLNWELMGCPYRKVLNSEESRR